MLSISQTIAIAIALVVFFGLVIPGVTRYVLLGGAALVLVGAEVFGGGHGFLSDFLR